MSAIVAVKKAHEEAKQQAESSQDSRKAIYAPTIEKLNPVASQMFPKFETLHGTYIHFSDNNVMSLK